MANSWPDSYVRMINRLEDFISPEPMSGCWLWLGGTSGAGYGISVQWKKGSIYIHRYLYEKLIGPIPAELDLDHICRNRCCVNPAHLEPVTRSENIRRGALAEVTRARKALRTQCPQGHSYDEKNTYLYRGIRCCRRCHANRVARKRKEKRGLNVAHNS